MSAGDRVDAILTTTERGRGGERLRDRGGDHRRVFILGIAVGVIAVIALSAVRYHRTLEDDERRGGPYYSLGRPYPGPGPEPPAPGPYNGYPDDESGDGPRPWPGR
jgi:hypothetical protein